MYMIMTGRAHCDLLINNICEVFNRQLLNARDSPIYTALEYVRGYIMKRIVLVQKVIEKSEGPLTPSVTKLFKVIMEEASQYKVEWNGGELFEVKGPWSQSKCVVNLNLKQCSCRKWEISGIPCRHAVACIFNMADNGYQVPIPEDWVHESYRLETWRKVYSHKVNPVPGPHFWEKSQFNQNKLIPPYIPPKIGRPGKKRKRSVGEINEMVKGAKLTRKGRTVITKEVVRH